MAGPLPAYRAYHPGERTTAHQRTFSIGDPSPGRIGSRPVLSVMGDEPEDVTASDEEAAAFADTSVGRDVTLVAVRL